MTSAAEPSLGDDPQAFIVLRAWKRMTTKVWTMGPDGPRKSVSKPPYLYRILECPQLTGVADVEALLRRIECDPHAVIVRGGLTAHGQAAASSKALVRRIKEDKTDRKDRAGNQILDLAVLCDVPRRWLLVDLDGVQCPGQIDPFSDPVAAVAYARSLLPEPFRDATCAYQWSGGALVAGNRVLKLHLWFWLDRAATSQELRAYFDAVDPTALVDHSLFDPIQQHFTSAPIFRGVSDPFAGSTRTGLLKGALDTVELPVPAPAEEVGANAAPAPSTDRERPPSVDDAPREAGVEFPDCCCMDAGPRGRAGSPGPLLAMAVTAGLLPQAPKRSGKWLIGRCPTGCDSARQEGVCHYHPDGSGFSCKRCKTKGGVRAWLVARGESPEVYEGLKPVVLTPTRAAKPVDPALLRRAWAAIDALRDEWRQRVVAHFRDVRGLQPELAERIANLPELIFIEDDAPAKVRKVLGREAAEAVQRIFPLVRMDGHHLPLWYAQYDARGDLISAHRRQEGPREAGGKGGHLPGAAEGRTYNRIPRAVEAAKRSETIMFGEGAPDSAVLAGLCLLDGAGAALAAASAGELEKVARELADALVEAQVPPSMVRIVCIPDREPSGVGMAGMEAAAKKLSMVGTVLLAPTPAGSDGHGDVADVARCGLDALRAFLASAEVIHRPPIDLRSPTARAEYRGAVRAGVAEATPDKLISLDPPPGCGKSYELAAVADDHAAAGAIAVYIVRNHDRAGETLDAIRRYRQAEGPTGRAEPIHWEGALRHCGIFQEHLEQGRAKNAAGLESAYAAGGRRALCGDPKGRPEELCPRARECRGFIGFEPMAWRVLVAPLACLGQLSFKPPACACGHAVKAGTSPETCTVCGAQILWPLLILDDPGDFETVELVPLDRLCTLYTGMADPWIRASRSATGQLAFAFEQLATDAQPPPDVASVMDLLGRGDDDRDRPEYDKMADITDDLRADPKLARLAALSDDDSRAPLPAPSSVRAGNGRTVRYDLGAWRLIQELRKFIRDPADLARVMVRITPENERTVEFHRPLLLPANARIVLADGTARHVEIALKALARLNGRTYEPIHIPVVGSVPVLSLHYDTGALRASGLYERKKGRVEFFEGAVGALKNALHWVQAAAFFGRGLRKGQLSILTHKAIADAFRWGVVLVANPAASPPEGFTFKVDGVARAIAELAAHLIRRGWRLRLGHFHADDLGSNEFEECDVLAVLGDPIKEMLAVQALARVLRIEEKWSELYSGLTAASCAQATARDRAIRRGIWPNQLPLAVSVVAGGGAPDGPELPGRKWRRVEAEDGPAFSLDDIDQTIFVAELATRLGALPVGVLRGELSRRGVGRTAAENFVDWEAARRRWREYAVPTGGAGRPWTIHAPSREAAEAVVPAGGGNLADLCVVVSARHDAPWPGNLFVVTYEVGAKAQRDSTGDADLNDLIPPEGWEAAVSGTAGGGRKAVEDYSGWSEALVLGPTES